MEIRPGCYSSARSFIVYRKYPKHKQTPGRTAVGPNVTVGEDSGPAQRCKPQTDGGINRSTWYWAASERTPAPQRRRCDSELWSYVLVLGFEVIYNQVAQTEMNGSFQTLYLLLLLWSGSIFPLQHWTHWSVKRRQKTSDALDFMSFIFLCLFFN